MIDKLCYKFFASIDKSISWIETKLISLSTWCWHKRVMLLNKRRKK